MIFPDFSQFSELATLGNFVPVYQEWVADLDTPVSAWYKVCAQQPYSFLLESVEGGENIGRYSFLGCDPLWILENKGEFTTQTHRDGSTETFTGDPFVTLTQCIKSFHPVKLPQLPPGIGGLFGFWGYELIQWMEKRVPIHPATETDLPDGLWMQIDQLLIFDQVKRKIWAISYADLRDPTVDLQQAYKEAKSPVTALISELQSPLDSKNTVLDWTPPQSSSQPLEYTSNISEADFCANVQIK